MPVRMGLIACKVVLYIGLNPLCARRRVQRQVHRTLGRGQHNRINRALGVLLVPAVRGLPRADPHIIHQCRGGVARRTGLGDDDGIHAGGRTAQMKRIPQLFAVQIHGSCALGRIDGHRQLVPGLSLDGPDLGLAVRPYHRVAGQGQQRIAAAAVIGHRHLTVRRAVDRAQVQRHHRIVLSDQVNPYAGVCDLADAGSGGCQKHAPVTAAGRGILYYIRLFVRLLRAAVPAARLCRGIVRIGVKII